MDFRFAERRDLTILAKIHVCTWQVAYRGIMPAPFLDALDASHGLARLAPVIDASPPRVGVVEIDGEVVAFCRFGPSKEGDVPSRTVAIFALNAEPTLWRLGVGRVLTDRVLQAACAQGFQACTLWCLNDNTRARCFYEAMGFKLDGATRTEAAESDHPLHEVRYRRLVGERV